MVEFEETSEGKKKKKGKVTQDVISKKIQTWADVETTMVEAVKDYERTHEGKILSSLQGLCHNVSNHGTTFSAWLELLPDGDYTSVLCGAFKLVIGVSQLLRSRDPVNRANSHRLQNRQRMSEILFSIASVRFQPC